MLFNNNRPKCLEVAHSKVVLAGQGLGGDDVGHHAIVQWIDDGAVNALGDGHGHEGLIHELSGRCRIKKGSKHKKERNRCTTAF